MTERALEEVELALGAAADADDALRETVRILAAQPGTAWAGIAFRDGGETVLGPSAGTPDAARRTVTPVAYEGASVGALIVDGEADPALLERVASLVAAHVLIGWDTGGEAWEP